MITSSCFTSTAKFQAQTMVIFKLDPIPRNLLNHKSCNLDVFIYFIYCASPRQTFYHSLKEHHIISNIPKFRCEML
jgi:hypothetical protein